MNGVCLASFPVDISRETCQIECLQKYLLFESIQLEIAIYKVIRSWSSWFFWIIVYERCIRKNIWHVSQIPQMQKCYAKPNLPNQTYQTKPTKPNLPNQNYQTKPTKLNLPNQTKPTKPNIPNQTYQTKLTNANLPNQTCQTKPTKPNQTTKHTERNLLNQNNWSKQSTPGSVVPLAMFFGCLPLPERGVVVAVVELVPVDVGKHGICCCTRKVVYKRLNQSWCLDNHDAMWMRTWKKMALYCPQGSGTLRQQLLMMHGIAWYCMVLHAWYCRVLQGIASWTILHNLAHKVYM